MMASRFLTTQQRDNATVDTNGLLKRELLTHDLEKGKRLLWWGVCVHDSVASFRPVIHVLNGIMDTPNVIQGFVTILELSS